MSNDKKREILSILLDFLVGNKYLIDIKYSPWISEDSSRTGVEIKWLLVEKKDLKCEEIDVTKEEIEQHMIATNSSYYMAKQDLRKIKQELYKLTQE